MIAPSIEPFLPPAQAKSDGILAVVTVLNSQPVEAVELTMMYRTPDGKRWRQVRTVQLGNTGCTPEPCLWAPVLFDVGVVDFDSVRIVAQPWDTGEPLAWRFSPANHLGTRTLDLTDGQYSIGDPRWRWVFPSRVRAEQVPVRSKQ